MKPRAITINPVLNGFVVQVGCQTVVVSSTNDLGHYITQYYNNPKAIEEAWIRGKVNDMMDGSAVLPHRATRVEEPCLPPTTGCCETEAKPSRNY